MTATSAPDRAASIWLPQSARLRDSQQEAPNVRTYELAPEPGPAGQTFTFIPGQFNMLYVPGWGETAISISSSPHATERLAHTVRVAGNVTSALAASKPGDLVAMRGPFGNPWPMEELQGRDVLIVAGGIGLAPLRPVIYHLMQYRHDYGAVQLVYGARASSYLLYRREYDTWRAAGIDVTVTIDQSDPHWKGHIGAVTELIPKARIDSSRARMLTCGPEIMMRFAAREAHTRGIASDHIYVSLERNMNCAVGICGHCQLGPEFICKDGPVLPYRRVEPYLRLEDL